MGGEIMKKTLVWISAILGYLAGVIIGFVIVGPAINVEFEIAKGFVKFLVSAVISFFFLGPVLAKVFAWIMGGIIIAPLLIEAINSLKENRRLEEFFKKVNHFKTHF